MLCNLCLHFLLNILQLLVILQGRRGGRRGTRERRGGRGRRRRRGSEDEEVGGERDEGGSEQGGRGKEGERERHEAVSLALKFSCLLPCILEVSVAQLFVSVIIETERHRCAGSERCSSRTTSLRWK